MAIPNKVSILGAEYTISYKEESEDKYLEGKQGYFKT